MRCLLVRSALVISLFLAGCSLFGIRSELDHPIFSRVVIIDARNGQELLPIFDRDSIELASLPTREISIRVDLKTKAPTTVIFGLNSKKRVRVDGTVPYTLTNGSTTRFKRWTPRLGRNVLELQALQDKQQVGERLTLSFDVRDTPVARPKARKSPTPAAVRTRTSPELPRSSEVRSAASPTPALAESALLLEDLQEPTPFPTPTPGFDPVRVNCGGPSFTDATGKDWQSDSGISTASKFGVSPKGDDALMINVYQTGRSSLLGPLAYRFKVPPGDYLVRLHFMELYVLQPGKQIFDILAEGRPLAVGLDIVAKAGARQPFKIERIVSVDDGSLDIDFEARTGIASISAIEVERANGG